MTIAVAYPGREGAHSGSAAAALFPDADLVPLPSFAAVATGAAAGEVAFGVLPIESSLSGPIAETHDLLYGSSLSITRETVLPIRHCLAATGAVGPEEIRVVRSHPAALAQCRRILGRMPWATPVAAVTTADAAAEVAAARDTRQAAITSQRAAELHGLTVLSNDVGDDPNARTRFVALAPYLRVDRQAEDWRTAFSFVTDHRPGALHAALEPFARHDVNLVRLVSRPLPAEPWEYRFDAVLAGHPLDPPIRATFKELRERTRQIRVFGSYPSHSERTAD
jgi:prephenate dehydratase